MEELQKGLFRVDCYKICPARRESLIVTEEYRTSSEILGVDQRF